MKRRAESNQKRLVVAAFVFCLVGAMMNASYITRIAERTTPAWIKPISRPVLNVAQTLGRVTGLAQVRDGFENLSDEVRGGKAVELGEGDGTVYLLAGDSVMENLVPSFSAIATKDGARVESRIERGTELGDPFVNWNKVLTEIVRAKHVDVVVLLMDVRGDSVQEAAALVSALVADVLDAGASSVVWLERPAVRNVEYESGRLFRREVLLTAQRQESGLVVLNPGVALVSSQGGYSSHVVTEKGVRVRVRQRDGVHLTPDGARLVAQALFDKLGA